MTRIELLGTSFQIQSDESPEYIDRLLRYYESRVDEIEQSVATGDPLKKAILAALLVTDELFRDREARPRTVPRDTDEIDRIADRIIREIDQVLPE
jgi:cell division protein ZapA (FtsZ GTPase activity inhibitor)